MLAISSIPLFGIYAAFGIAPQTVTTDIPVTTVIQEIALPHNDSEADQSFSTAQTFWQLDEVRRDDTLSSLMTRLNIRNAEAVHYLRNDAGASAFAARLRPGRSVQAQTNAEGVLLDLRYQLDSESVINIYRDENGSYQSQSIVPELEARSMMKTAEIKSSLFAATDAAGIPDQIALQLAEIFSSDIDFHSDLRQGDQFAVIYEANYNQGEQVKAGQVLAAEFINQGRTYRAVRYVSPEGRVNYYTPEGKSLHKSFLRSPLEFSRISSGFSLGRFHPILQRMRAHKGVDYAAPSGTRIKASADGVVEFVGKKGGYGNVIVLRHQNGIKTIYGHLSRFASGISRGTKVSQSEIIGFVGMTGMATGPHLHYEFLLHGQHRDPLKVALPTAQPLPAEYRTEFAGISSNLNAQLDLMSARNVATLE